MGTGLFDYIAQACQSLAASTAPSITAMGTHIVLALATIMLVWFGVQESLASAHGGPGFSMDVEPSAPIRLTRLVVPPSMRPFSEKPSPGMELS